MNEWAMKDDYIIHKDKRMTVQFKRTNKIKREREREIEELKAETSFKFVKIDSKL